MDTKLSIKPFKHITDTTHYSGKKEKTRLNRNKTQSDVQGAMLQVHNMFIIAITDTKASYDW